MFEYGCPVSAKLKQLFHYQSQVCIFVYCNIYVGVGGSKPIQVCPVMKSNSSPQNTSLIPVQETNNTPHKPRSFGIADSDFHGDNAELDNYQTDRPIPPLSAEERRIKKLKYESQEETGQGPFEDGHMIKVQQRYGVLKCVFEVDNKLMAGVELVSAILQIYSGITEIVTELKEAN